MPTTSKESSFNPDVLSCLANLSSDEVFTPPKIVNDMLDMLPQKLFRDPNTTFLDPACKTGVFLREIAKRLIEGLEQTIPDLNQRLEHIYRHQIFGIGMTEITALISRRSLYCSKYADGEYSVVKFQEPDGNIQYKRTMHTWSGGSCIYCGAPQEKYQRNSSLESHAYEFIHKDNPEGIFKMKFDVIIGNPPYQLSDDGHGMSAKPIYHLFITQAMKLNPRFLTMIVPARWYAGGKGLDDFRTLMLNDNRISKLVDYGNSTDVFSGVDIAGGICYFLWERDKQGPCEVVSYTQDTIERSVRYLNEFRTFIRSAKAVAIVNKVLKVNKDEGNNMLLSDAVSSRKPFGLPTNYTPKKSGIPCWFIQKIGLKYAATEDVIDPNGILGKWKLLVPPTPIAGQTDFTKPVKFYYDGNIRIAKPGECCTESYIVVKTFDSEKETLSFKSYLFTKTVRFLLLQTVVSQHVTKKNFCFIPDLIKYSEDYTDEMLCEKWGISEEEWKYIESRISDAKTQEDSENVKE